MLNDLYQMLDPIAFAIGPIEVRWYGLAYVVGFAIGALVIWRTAKRWDVRIDEDALLTVCCCVIFGVIFGARLGYVLFYGPGLDYYLANPLEILAFHKGGMSFHGAFAGALISGIFAARMTGIPYLTLVDLAITGAPLGIFFGRCANFVNGELWGAQTDLPWGVVFGGSAGMIPRHPSQLYEAVLEGLVIFAVLYLISRSNPPKPRGTQFGVFLVMYGCFRFAIEFVRQPDAQLGYLWGDWLTMGQVLSVPLIVAGVCVLIWAMKTKKSHQGLPDPL